MQISRWDGSLLKQLRLRYFPTIIFTLTTINYDHHKNNDDNNNNNNDNNGTAQWAKSLSFRSAKISTRREVGTVEGGLVSGDQQAAAANDRCRPTIDYIIIFLNKKGGN